MSLNPALFESVEIVSSKEIDKSLFRFSLLVFSLPKASFISKALSPALLRSRYIDSEPKAFLI